MLDFKQHKQQIILRRTKIQKKKKARTIHTFSFVLTQVRPAVSVGEKGKEKKQIGSNLWY